MIENFDELKLKLNRISENISDESLIKAGKKMHDDAITSLCYSSMLYHASKDGTPMTENKGIWQDGMYIPPDKIADLIKQYEGMPIRIEGSDQVVGHVTNVRRVESGISFDITRMLENEEQLELIEKNLQKGKLNSSGIPNSSNRAD